MTRSAPAFERYRDIVDDYDAFVEASARSLPICVWANTLRTDADEVRSRLEDAGMEPRPLPWLDGAFRLRDGARPSATTDYIAGLLHVQEEVSLVPPHLLDARPGERVIDLCAAPGGKAVRIALSMKNRGMLIANDRNVHRIRSLRAVTERLAILNMVGTIHNAANLPRSYGSFDRVLADVPCSGEGTSRKNPHLLTDSGRGTLPGLVVLQRAILARAVQICRPGGRVVYSTCTYAPEENEGVVDYVLRQNEGRLRVAPVQVEGLRAAPGVTSWDGVTFDPSLGGALRFWPHLQDTGGFFAVVLEKSSDAPSRDEGAAPASLSDYDTSECLHHLRERFGVVDPRLTELRYFRRNRRHAEMIAADVEPPPTDDVQFLGAHFYHVGTRVPMPSSVTARLVGGAATRNVVALAPEQIGAYVRRERVIVSGDQVAGGGSRGPVLVAADGISLGTGFLREAETGFELESFFPKGISQASGF